MRNSKKDEQGREVRTYWHNDEWDRCARYVLATFPQFCANEEGMKRLTVHDLDRMQNEVIPAENHRPIKSIQSSPATKKHLWAAIERIRAAMAEEAKNLQQPASLPAVVGTNVKSVEAVSELPPVTNNPLPEEVKTVNKINDTTSKLESKTDEVRGLAQNDDHDEGESQLMFIGRMGTNFGTPITPAALAAAQPKPAPLPESVIISQQLAPQLTPAAAMDILMQMPLGNIMEMFGDRLLQHMLETKGDVIMEALADKIAPKLIDKLLANATKTASATPAPATKPAPAVATQVAMPQVETKTETKQEPRSLQEQLSEVRQKAPNLRKPKIAIVGLKKKHWDEISRSFEQFEFQYLEHGNDGIKKLKEPHKVIGITEWLGGKNKALRDTYGSNFVELHFGISSIKRQIEMWDGCYQMDPDYFKMNDAQRNVKNEEYAHQ